MNRENIDYLLNSNPYTEYRTRIDLLGQPEDSPEVISCYDRMINYPLIISLVNEMKDWPGKVLNSHKSAGQLYHKLAFLADVGIKASNPTIYQTINKILVSLSDEGVFQSVMNIPTHFGGTGQDQYAWVLCDAPILTYTLARFGLQNDLRVVRSKEYLKGLCRDNGFPCAASKEVGRFRGPGRKEDPCPYATLIMLKVLSIYNQDKEAQCTIDSINILLDLWNSSMTKHPYMFYMGTDFRKLKTPMIWYDILNLADTLSNFDYAIKDRRFSEIVDSLENKITIDNKYTPESIWKAWSDWDFGQKKVPSPWITFIIYRIRMRLNRMDPQ
jgi:hypothetical protein